MTEQEAAEKVVDKVIGLSKHPRQIGVFVGKERNTIQMTRPHTDVFEKAIKVRCDDFCGVYDERATVEMIVEDLRYAGFHP